MNFFHSYAKKQDCLFNLPHREKKKVKGIVDPNLKFTDLLLTTWMEALVTLFNLHNCSFTEGNDSTQCCYNHKHAVVMYLNMRNNRRHVFLHTTLVVSSKSLEVTAVWFDSKRDINHFF